MATVEAETGRLQIQSLSQIYSNFKASLRNLVRPYPKHKVENELGI